MPASMTERNASSYQLCLRQVISQILLVRYREDKLCSFNTAFHPKTKMQLQKKKPILQCQISRNLRRTKPRIIIVVRLDRCYGSVGLIPVI